MKQKQDDGGAYGLGEEFETWYGQLWKWLCAWVRR
jgi:hypothetical protein